MHEMSLAESLLDLAVSYAEGQPITMLKVRLGPLSGVVSDSLDFCFDMLSKGTLAEGARIAYERVPLDVVCRQCGATVPTEAWQDLAPYDVLSNAMAQGCACGSHDMEMRGGFDFRLLEIEVRESKGQVDDQ